MKKIIILSALVLSTAASANSGLSKAQVRELVQPTESTVASCANTAGVFGTLKVRFHVKPDGTVTDFTSLAPHKDDAAAKCAADAITAIKFPESGKGRHSKYRFQLGRKSGGSATAPTGEHKKSKKDKAAPAPATPDAATPK